MEMNYLARQLISLGANLSAGTRLAMGRSVSRREFSYSLDQGIWLILLLVLLEILIGYMNTDPPAVFNHYGINYLSATYLADFLILLLIARLAGAGLEQTGCLFIANLAVSPAFLVIMHLLGKLLEANPSESVAPLIGQFILLLAWQVFILIRILRLYLPLQRAKTTLLAGLNTGLVIASMWIFPQSELWYSDSDTQANSPYAAVWELNVEDIFYSQYALMDEAIEGIAAHRPGITDLYLVALAGYGYEKVFLNEVEYVRELFERKFDTRDRSLVMANNSSTLNQYPLANHHNLTDALHAIGGRIDPQEDILFLFMTSHGSKDHKFSVDFGPIRMNDLTPQQVKQSLDDAGIRWRVILVSSCYSGGFIKPLEDPYTLVITAAAADRQSFGCGMKSEFTDFGNAYFKQGLAQQPDFIDAFDIAAKLVQEKEQKERRTPSNPQIYVGDAIRPKLALLFDELALDGQFTFLAEPGAMVEGEF